MAFKHWHAGHTINIRQPYGSCRLPNSSTCKSWNITKHDHLIHHIYHITSWPYHITNPCKNKLDASTLSLHILRGLGLSEKNHSYLRTRTTTLIQELSIYCCKLNLNYGGRDCTRKATCAIPVARQAWSRSQIRGHVKLARAASSHHPARCKVHESEATIKTSTPAKPLCSTRATDLRIDMALIPLLGS